MRARCRREGLLSACQLASAALPAREVKPILRNLKAVAADGRCTLMATDLEVGIRLDVQGLAIEEPGEAILPAARLIAILREAHDEELTIEADPDRLRGARADAGVRDARRRPGPVPRMADVHRGQVPRDLGRQPARDDPPHRCSPWPTRPAAIP